MEGTLYSTIQTLHYLKGHYTVQYKLYTIWMDTIQYNTNFTLFEGTLYGSIQTLQYLKGQYTVQYKLYNI